MEASIIPCMSGWLTLVLALCVVAVSTALVLAILSVPAPAWAHGGAGGGADNVATILVLGSIVGLSNLRGALNAELSELANAYLALSQGYAFSGISGCCASTDGSQAG